MILPPTLFVLALVSAQAKTDSGPHFPEKPQESAALAKLSDWHGWAYLAGAPAVWPKIYETSGDWSGIQAHFGAVKATSPATWNLKVVIFTRTELDGRDKGGVLRERRGTIESTQLAQIREALDRFQAYVLAKYDGAVKIVPDIQVESEWMRGADDRSFGPEFANKYFEARINGGTYEAEDKIFRGPFHSVIYILPGATADHLDDAVVNDTPVAAVNASPVGQDGVTQSLDTALRQAWVRQVAYRAAQHGFRGIAEGVVAGSSDTPWAIATDLAEEAPEKYLANLNKTLGLNQAVDDPADVKLSMVPTTDAQLVADTEKGQVLKVLEVSGQRDGGVVLPGRADGVPLDKLDAAPTLNFSVKSSSKDPLSIRIESTNGKVAWISLGADPTLVRPMQGAPVVSVPFVPNGKWQPFTVDLRSIAQQSGLVDVARMAIEPSPNAKLGGKLQPEPVEYEFDQFKFSSDAAGPLLGPVSADAASEDPEARALFAAQAKSASPALAALLKDKSELVRLNATNAYVGFKDATVEEALISNSVDLDPSVASAALKALMADGSDVARAVVLRSVSVSLSDFNKITAAKLLADTKDPKVADDVSRLLASRSWQAHVAAVEMLAEIPTPESQIWRLAFLGMSEPAVKLAVIRTADPTVEKVQAPLLWSAVNEPSDRVRAESYIKLIQAAGESNKSEGYKGVRDDSTFVRKLVVQYLTEHPSEDHRNALRIAIADKSAAVRAAALEGFAQLEKGASSDEIANVLDDQNSDVQLALIDFSKKKGMKLPPKTLSTMLSSPDRRVSAAAKALG